MEEIYQVYYLVSLTLHGSIYLPGYKPKKSVGWMVYSVDPDQTIPLGLVWSGSILFAQNV